MTFIGMLRPILYYTLTSPPSRSTLLSAAAIGLKLDIKDVNLAKREHLTPEFLKINPQHTLPTLNDNGFILWDSHSINTYLVRKYAKNDNLYPKDPAMRAKVDQCMYFDCGSLFYAMSVIFIRPILYKGKKGIEESEMYLIKDAYRVLEKMLDGKEWLVGDSYTLADISNVCSISTLELLKPFDTYPNIKEWVKRCEKNIPGYVEWNLPGVEKFRQIMKLPSSNL
ncbi:glutathione S-transferase 1-1-like isoform X2 [Leptopilina heterotoma]|uniref:glutathione S-transferase 1-1-like isoform X2 n=1 Tax=Leptopilina heterotoma TaxID=63436 RepID=UPI001CA7B6E6|nr:glutathione S-transferase 1-1-like isoform X2 [Leptopilina heterotoma]